MIPNELEFQATLLALMLAVAAPAWAGSPGVEVITVGSR